MPGWYENCKGTCNTQKQMIVFRPPPKVKNLRDRDANKLTILNIQITHHFKNIELEGISPSLTKQLQNLLDCQKIKSKIFQFKLCQNSGYMI